MIQSGTESSGGVATYMGAGETSDPVTTFNGQFYIHSGKPMPDYDQGPVKAFAASGLTDVSQVTHFALVCEPSLVPRSRAASAFAAIINPSLVKLVATGPIYWPPARAQRYVFIYENINGRRMTPHGVYKGLDWKPELVHMAVVKPLALALMDMFDTDLTHGNICPSNLYVASSANGSQRVVLGECLATPPSYTQPVLFEPIERAMIDSVARGIPTRESDMYALGASLAVILRSRDPMEGLTDEETIKFRMENGSYVALAGKDRFSGDIMELLRGLLNDDPTMRWTMDDLNGWLDGQRLSPKQSAKKVKAARPFHFMNERYFRPSLLAMDLNKSQSEAVQAIENGHLAQWISRSLEDSSIEKRLEEAIESTAEHGRGPGFWDRLLARVSVALDPDAPIRYKDRTYHPEGFGYAMAEAMIKRADVQPFLDLINQQMVTFWLMAQSSTSLDVGSIVTRFDNCRAFLRQNNIAYGVERCLYFLCPECPCLSEKLKGFYIRSPEDMLFAYEKISSQPNRPELFLDRHTICFLSVKDRKVIDPYLMDLNSEEMHKRIAGNVKTLATIQQRSQMPKFPGICKWIYQILDPVYERIHDRELRKSMKTRIGQLADAGDIAKIASIIDNPVTMQKDTEGYNQTRMDYYHLRLEAQKLEAKLANPSEFGRSTGREVAAVASCIIAGITILFFVFMYLTRGSVF